MEEATEFARGPAGSALLVAAWACLFLLAFKAIALAVRAADRPEVVGVRPDTWALKAAMLLHHVFVGPIALVLIFRDPVVYGALSCFGCDEYAQLLVRDPDVQVPAAIVWLVPVTVGYMVADLCLIGCWDLSGKGSRLEFALMVVHHVLSIITWPHTIWYDFCARYVLFLVAYELSSIFLTLNWMLSTAGKKQDSAYFASGLLFTASFVAVRLAGGLPQIVAMWNTPPWRHVSGVPDYVWMGSVVLVLPHVLNFFWGVKVARGFLGVAAGVLRRQSEASAGSSTSGSEGSPGSGDEAQALKA